MKYKYLIPTLIILILSVSCGSKKVAEDKRPLWVKERPILDEAYVGIGKTSKTKNPYDYIKKAKNNALSDISSEISVNISSSSLLSSVETNDGFVDTYSSLIKSKTKNDLQGYTLVSTYETETDYWCYYQLDKNKYQKLIKAKKDKAISKSIDFYKRSTLSEGNNDLKSAIILNIKAIDAIKNYWIEGIKVNIDESDIFLGNELISNLSNLTEKLRIIPKSKQINGVRGKPITSDLLSFTIESDSGVAQEGIPVVFYYSDGRLAKNKQISTHTGNVSYSLKKLSSKKNRVTIYCKVNMPKLIDEVTNDYLLHSLLDKIDVHNAEINIHIRNPIIYIKSDEKTLNRKNDNQVINNVLSSYLQKKGLEISKNKDKSDIEIIIISNTEKFSKNSDRLYTSKLDVSIKMVSNNNTVYTYSIDNFYGRGGNYEIASTDAYSKIKSDIEVKAGNQIYRFLID